MKKTKSSRKNKIRKNSTYKKNTKKRRKLKKKRVSKVKRQSGGGSFNPQALNGIKKFLDGMKPTKATFVMEKGSQNCDGLNETTVNGKTLCYYSNMNNNNSGNSSAQQNSIPFTQQQMVGTTGVQEITGMQDGFMGDNRMLDATATVIPNGIPEANATVIPNGMPEANATVPGNVNEISVVENTGKTNNNKVINANSTIREVPPVIDVTQPQVAEVAEVTLSNSNGSNFTKKNLGLNTSRLPKIDITNGGISQKFGKQFGLAKKAMKGLGKSRNNMTKKLNERMKNTSSKMKQNLAKNNTPILPI